MNTETLKLQIDTSAAEDSLTRVKQRADEATQAVTALSGALSVLSKSSIPAVVTNDAPKE